MCITCTDTKVLAGPDLSKCFYFYGTTRAKVQHFNEVRKILIIERLKNSSKHS
jgi:tRNA G26 N,N-dimethylase Trm1